MKKVLTIQIPTWRNLRQLRDTLHSLVMHTEYPYIIKVINNDGTDDGKRDVENIVASMKTDSIKVLHSGTNLGWCGAHNMALKECDTPFVCLLNDDVVFTPWDQSWWRRLMLSFSDPSVGAVGPCSNFVMGGQNLWHINLGVIMETNLLIGFCVAMRTDVIKKIGGLDESLPGGDDFDWSIRIRDAGYRLMINRGCFLYHIGQQTGKRVNGSYWDSAIMQDRVNNALIRKHGVKKWYRTYCAEPYDPVEAGEMNYEGVLWEKIGKEMEGQMGFEIGCGNKKVATFGLDIARKGESGAGGRKFTQASPDVTADCLNMPVGDGSLDYIIAPHIFEHLIDPLEALDEWHRVLKPDGKLFITAPNQDKMVTMIIDHTHVHAYTPSSAKNIVSRAGFKVDVVEEIPNSGAFVLRAHKEGACQ